LRELAVIYAQEIVDREMRHTWVGRRLEWNDLRSGVDADTVAAARVVVGARDQ
jgi:hypothetical protein